MVEEAEVLVKKQVTANFLAYDQYHTFSSTRITTREASDPQANGLDHSAIGAHWQELRTHPR